MIATDTKQRILDAAEQLFADQGFAGTSLRAIIAEADVNLAAVHYHFHSKEALLESVVVRRLGPLNEERLALLNECEEEAGREGPSLEKILEAFLVPPVLLIRNTQEGHLFGKLLGRLHSEPGASFAVIAKKHFSPVFQRFQIALKRAAPDVPLNELLWRMHFSIGAMAYTLTSSDDLDVISEGRCKSSDVETAIGQLIDFLAAGFRAPAGRNSRLAQRKRNYSEKRR